jgi:ATP-dependent Clp protease protease subunit
MTNGVPAQAPPKLPKQIYGFFAGPIDQQAVQRVCSGLMAAINGGVEEIHMLFQSSGGIVGDGIFIYNIFQTAPVDIILYNAGTVASIGVLAYLGADKRRTTRNATFMIHRTSFSPVGATSDRLQAAANAAALDDQRTEQILHDSVTLSQEKWDVHKVADLWLSADEALNAKIATEIADFAPPMGSQLFYLGPV